MNEKVTNFLAGIVSFEEIGFNNGASINRDDYPKYSDFVIAIENKTAETKKVYSNAKKALDNYAKKNPETIKKIGASKFVSGIAIGGVSSEFFGFDYEINIDGETYKIRLKRFVSSNKIEILTERI